LLARADAVEVLIVDHQRSERVTVRSGAEIARRLAALGARVEVQPLSPEDRLRSPFAVAGIAFRADLLVMGAMVTPDCASGLFGGSHGRPVSGGLPVLMSR